jgi:hypothetical protein
VNVIRSVSANSWPAVALAPVVSRQPVTAYPMMTRSMPVRPSVTAPASRSPRPP